MVNYRFLKEEKGQECHLHQYRKDENSNWENMTGASTIVSILDKSGLVWWASGKAVETLGWMHPNPKINGKYIKVSMEERLEHLKPYYDKIKSETEEEYLSLLDDAYKAHSVRLGESAEAGTSLHEKLENYVKDCMEYGIENVDTVGSVKQVKDFEEFTKKYIKRFIWSEAHMYDEDLFVGGISDCGAVMKDGSNAIIDFKSSKEAYFSHFVQISLYNVLFEKNGLVTANGEQLATYVYPISKYFVIPFGASEFTVHENTNIHDLKKCALSCVNLYREKINFENQ